MGLDFAGSEAHWSYSGFNRFRRKLAQMINMNLDAMEGYGGNTSWDTITDDIKDFLNHSDCEGHLTPKQCRVIAPRLKELVKDWPDEDYDKITALILANDMLELVKKKRYLRFQ
jgi:hypothetical protein